MATHQSGSPPPQQSRVGSPSTAGLTLPKVHLGSFSAMNVVDDMHENGSAARGDIPVPTEEQHVSSPQMLHSNTSGTNGGDGYYGSVNPAPMEMSNDVWQQLQPQPTSSSPPAQQQQQQQQPPTRHASIMSSPSSFMPSGSISQQVDTPPTEVGSPSLNADPASTTLKSLSYLPPGAASPYYNSPSSGYTAEMGMAGIGSGGGRATMSAYSRTGMSSASPPPAVPQERERATVRSQYFPVEQPPQQHPETDGAYGDTVNDGPGPSQVERQSMNMSPNPPHPIPSPDIRRMNQESTMSNGVPLQDPGYGSPTSRRRTSQYYSQQAPPVNQSSPYPSMPSASQQQMYITDVQPQPQAQTRGGPKVAAVVVEEVCIECMMRDRDMADVDVMGEGVWERESDASYNELVRMEEEACYSGRSADYHQSTGRPRATGGPLTTDNLKVWLTMNPKEPQARWQTLEAYLKSQSALLVAEAAARAQAIRESRLLDNRMRETYSQIRESSQDLSLRQPYGSATNLPSPGVPIRVPRSASVYSTVPVGSPEKDATLLESGLIVEKIDLRKEEQEERARIKREGQQRLRMSTVGINDAASAYSAPSPTLDGAAMYLPGNSPYGLPNHSMGQLSPSSNKRFSVVSGGPGSSIRPSVHRAPSHMSTDTTTTGVRRFFGYRSWNGRSQSSLALSGSMMDMHLGLDQDRRTYAGQQMPYDLSAPPSLVHGAGDPSYLDRGFVTEPDVANDRASNTKTKKKTKGLGKLWKMMTGQNKNSVEQPKGKTQKYSVEEDLSQPLAPPPPISYLVNGRSDHGPHSKHRSSPSLSTGLGSPPRENGGEDPRGSYSRDDGGFEGDTGDERDDSYRSQARRPSGSDPRLQQARVLASSPTPMHAEKILPALPYDNSMAPQQPIRPATLYANRNESYSQGDLLVPRAPFGAQTRRQSFNGMPNGVQNPSWAPPNQNGFVPPAPPVATRYSEFGASRRSLGPIELSRKLEDEDATLSKRSTKTGSRFGISAFFAPSRKSSQNLPPMLHLGTSSSATLAPTRAHDASHGRDHSISHSSFSDVGNPRSNGSHNARASVASTKKLALIPQEEDFVAYRYPSHSQTLPTYR
ncbi:hypothetical protein FRB94_008804 [Tulasnella sp. JGI-2019a]|nr:hypothetical protein FRB94_008804 [Tulasnella sp. JGI-2019a]